MPTIKDAYKCKDCTYWTTSGTEISNHTSVALRGKQAHSGYTKVRYESPGGSLTVDDSTASGPIYIQSTVTGDYGQKKLVVKPAGVKPIPYWDNDEIPGGNAVPADTRTPQQKADDEKAWYYHHGDNDKDGIINGLDSTPNGVTNNVIPKSVQPSVVSDTRTQAEKEADLYAASAKAIDAAKAGNPEPLRNFDRFFGITRPEEEYTQAFYSIPKLKLIRGDGPAGPDDGNGNIGNGAAVYAVNASGDKFHITAAAAAEMRVNGTWTEPAVVSQSEVDNNYTTSFAINSASEIGIVNQKRTSQGYLLIRGDGPASADDGGLNSGNGAAVYALDKNGNMFHVTAAAAAEMRANGDWPTPFVMNQNKVDSMGVDGRMVGLGNIQPIVAVGPPPVPPAPEPVATAPEPAPGEPGSVVEPDTGSTTTPAPEPDDSSDTSTEAPATPVDEPTPESITDAPAPEPEVPAAPEVDEQAQQEAAAAQEQEQEEEAALATATAAKHSAKESRMKKLMSMRKPWSSGASSSTGSDAMVAPPITPSSQIPPPPL